MIVLALDPGPTHSALLAWDGKNVLSQTVFDNNEDIRQRLIAARGSTPLVIEKIESYGMAVGMETFETVWWSGRFAEAYGIEHALRMPRKAVKLHLCNSTRATDSNIRYAILDRFGGKDAAIGRKNDVPLKPLYGITGHLWSALAIALTYWDMNCVNATDAV